MYFDNQLTEKYYVKVSELIDDMCVYYGDGITDGMIAPSDIYRFIGDEYSLDEIFTLRTLTEIKPEKGKCVGFINIKFGFERAL